MKQWQRRFPPPKLDTSFLQRYTQLMRVKRSIGLLTVFIIEQREAVQQNQIRAQLSTSLQGVISQFSYRALMALSMSLQDLWHRTCSRCRNYEDDPGNCRLNSEQQNRTDLFINSDRKNPRNADTRSGNSDTRR